MSSISAGKLNSTALVHVGDRTGELVFKTNTTETALTIDSAQNAVFTGDVSVTGNLTINGTTTSFGDGDKLVLGDGDDFEIYHDGSNSYISDGGTGNLVIDTNGSLIKLASTQTDKTMATFNKDGSVELYHDNSQKLQTSSSGVTVTGTLDADNIPGTLGSEGQVLTVDAGGTTASWTDAGGGGSADFVASGAISNGDVVVLKSDGTVAVITSSVSEVNPVTEGTHATWKNDTNWNYMATAFDPDQNTVMIVYTDTGNSSYGTAIAGQVSGSTISFGTPVVFTSTAISQKEVAYDPDAQKFVTVFKVGSTGGGTCLLTVTNGTTISAGAVNTMSSSGAAAAPKLAYDTSAQKWLFVYADEGNSSYVYYEVGTVSGTSMSFGASAQIYAQYTLTIDVTYDVNSGNMVVALSRQAVSGDFKVFIGPISGTSVTWTQAHSSNNYYVGITGRYDATENKILYAFRDYYGSPANYGKAMVGTVSGTSISFGTIYTFDSGGTVTVPGPDSIAYSPDTGSYLIQYVISNVVYVIRANLSGSTITFQTRVEIGPTWSGTENGGIVYDTNANKFVMSMADADNSTIGISFVINENSVTTDVADYFGVAAEDIDSAGTGSINIIGGINEGQTGLTVNSSYFVADDGSLTTTNNGRKIGRGVASTKLLVDTALTPAEMNAYLGGLV